MSFQLGILGSTVSEFLKPYGARCGFEKGTQRGVYSVGKGDVSTKDNKAKMFQAFLMTTFSSSLFVRQGGRAKEYKESL
jgi:hypothetical protein